MKRWEKLFGKRDLQGGSAYVSTPQYTRSNIIWEVVGWFGIYIPTLLALAGVRFMWIPAVLFTLTFVGDWFIIGPGGLSHAIFKPYLHPVTRWVAGISIGAAVVVYWIFR